MKSIFLGDEHNIRRVYFGETTDRLIAAADLVPTVYSGDDVLAGNLVDTKYIFSTWGMPTLSADDISKHLPNLRAVFYAAGTVQYFARPFISNGVRVFSAWQANAVPVAEYATAQIILANKGFFGASRLYKSSFDAAKSHFRTFSGNFGGYVGIIGAGAIGKMVIERLHSYNLKIKVFDPFLPDDTAAALGVEKCDLPELFSSCMTISNHLANNEQTKNMLNYSLFSKMRDNAVFINTGRGAQVVEEDLAKAMRECPNRTAVLDVTVDEPIKPGHPFYGLDNVILTPHIAGSSGDEVHRMSEYMADEFDRVIAGETPLYEVTEAMLETMA